MNCVKVILDRFPVIEIQMYKLSSFDDEYIFYMYILGFLQDSLLFLCVLIPQLGNLFHCSLGSNKAVYLVPVDGEYELPPLPRPIALCFEKLMMIIIILNCVLGARGGVEYEVCCVLKC